MEGQAGTNILFLSVVFPHLGQAHALITQNDLFIFLDC